MVLNGALCAGLIAGFAADCCDWPGVTGHFQMLRQTGKGLYMESEMDSQFVSLSHGESFDKRKGYSHYFRALYSIFGLNDSDPR